MKTHSKDILDSLKVFFFLEKEIKDSLSLLEDIPDSRVIKNALRIINIDIFSFIDEMDLFNKFLYKGGLTSFDGNLFILLTHRPLKLLRTKTDGIKSLRNTIHAHNFRNSQKTVVTPWEQIISNYKKAPISKNDLKLYGQIVLLIIRAAHDCFKLDSHKVYNSLMNSFAQHEQDLKKVFSEDEELPDNYIDMLEKDMYLMRDAIRSSDDNYRTIASQLGCRLISPF